MNARTGSVAAAGAQGDGGVPKQLREVAGAPMLLHIIRAIRASWASGLVVVASPQIAPVLDAWSETDDDEIQYVVNRRPESEMIESIQLGLRAASGLAGYSQRCGFVGDDGFMICPGDHPCITPQVIDRCIDAFAQNPARIIIATHCGRRGHPMIIPADLVLDVLSWPPARGLNELRRLHADRVALVEVDDPGVLIDVDTPEDLQRARNHMRGAG